MRKLVEIVYDSEKGKYRAKPVGQSGWVRFPNHLRVPGAVYEVEELKEGKNGSWIASGEISLIKKEKVSYKKSA
jgi:hypothetical protein